MQDTVDQAYDAVAPVPSSASSRTRAGQRVATERQFGLAGACGRYNAGAGRWLADRVGRRLTGAMAMVAVALFATLDLHRFRADAVGDSPASMSATDATLVPENKQ